MNAYILIILVLLSNIPLSSYAYEIDSKKVSVSGISSGSYMAGQVHMANSKYFMGVGLVAGGPYYCSRGSYARAMYACSRSTRLGHPHAEEFVNIAKKLSSENRIDSLSNVLDDQIYIFTGQNDHTVLQTISYEVEKFFLKLGNVPSQIKLVDMPGAGHLFPTKKYGVPCSEASKSPFIGNCDYDAAKDILTHIYGPLKEKKEAIKENFIQLSQEEFAGVNPKEISMHDYAVVYVPTRCKQDARCKLHVAIHGCRQSIDYIGDVFYKNAGYNEWAEANDIIILYPQSAQSYKHRNPKACWDFWGYLGKDFHTREAPQIKTIMKMVDYLLEN